jgi:hypothetical protein
LAHAVHLRFALLALLFECCEFFVHSVFAAEECVHLVLFDREARLDRLLASPVLAVGLTLDKDLGVISISVPAETDCLCAFCLLEAAQIEFEVFVIKIDGCDSRVFSFELLVRIKY